METVKPNSIPIWGETGDVNADVRMHTWDVLGDGYLSNRFEWNLIAFAAGIALYFGLPTEPDVKAAVGALGLAFICLFLCLKYWSSQTLWLPVAFCLMGGVYGVFHTAQTSSPMLPDYHKKYRVEGWIEKATTSGKMQQIYVGVERIDGLSPSKTPKRVRIRLKPGAHVPGDSIHINAVLNRPPGPAIAGGYDPARRAFFEQMGGYGFAVGTPDIVEAGPLSIGQRLKRGLVTYRYGLSRHIQLRAPPSTAGLQAALLTGDRSAIPDNHETYLRDAGLAHLLAISGLHMGLLAGGAYYFASLIFAMIGPMARRYDMRKSAAVVGMMFATGYLLLSGASVSTQRAYIMAMIVFLAVIMDRRAVSMRSVAVAAAITLLLHPENLMNAGFQMSFSATAALVAVYRAWADRRDRYNDDFRANTFLNRLWRGFVGLSVTSFVAGSATAGFAALQFHRIANYGFVGNLVAMPMFTFIAMPSGFLAVIAMPLGLDGLFLQIMSWGLEYVLGVSKWVSEQKGAVGYLKGANNTVIAIFGLGFALACIGPKTVRIWGTVLIVAAMALWVNIDKPDMRVSEDGRIAFWDQEGAVLRVDRKRSDKFGRTQFLEKSGFPTASVEQFSDSAVPCDAIGCRFRVKNYTVSVLYEPQGVLEACSDSDLVILTERIAGPVAKWKCDVPLIDTRALAKNGSLDIAFSGERIKLTPANPKTRQARPWGH